MLPEPLHPAVVHFPIALSVLLPLFAVGALVAIRRGASLRPVWTLPVGLALALTLSAWASIETGEAEEDRVEAVVPETAIHTHEERAELFLVLSGTVLVVLAGGLVGGTIGSAARAVGTVATILLLIPAARVGASGGELVYEHGAGQAYVRGAVPGPAQARSFEHSESSDDHDPEG